MGDIFDLVVIGSGPGGMKAAIQGAKLGKSVAVVEKDRPGGNCVFTGTIPSKSLREGALLPEPYAKARARMLAVIEAETKVITNQLTRNKVQVLKGTASFLSTTELVLQESGQKVQGKHFVIATGSTPHRSKDFAFDGKTIFDSDSILSLEKLPTHLLVVGAGVIGCEYASIFSHLGSKVTVVDKRKELLRSVDHEVIQSLHQEFLQSEMELLLGCDLGKITPNGKGGASAMLNGSPRDFDAVLICMGRFPNSQGLNLEKLGITLDERGNIPVNRENYQTVIENIYAVGDVIGQPALATSSAEQGRIASCRIFGLPAKTFPDSFPYGIYTIPEISSVGAMEEDLKKQNIPFVVGRASFSELARGLIVGDKNGFIKLLVHSETRKILGIHGIGIGVSELIHIGQVVRALDAPVDFLVQNVFNYPTFAEAFKVAALNCVNKMKR